MSRRNSKHDPIGGQFVAMLTETLNSRAWLAMSHGARLLYLALKQRYSTGFKNNGRVYPPPLAPIQGPCATPPLAPIQGPFLG